MLPYGTTPKIKDFRTFLEIFSFALAGKPTDANFVYYRLQYRLFSEKLTKAYAIIKNEGKVILTLPFYYDKIFVNKLPKN